MYYNSTLFKADVWETSHGFTIICRIQKYLIGVLFSI